jgi:hypothetical protein
MKTGRNFVGLLIVLAVGVCSAWAVDFWVDVDAALSEVQVNFLPAVSSEDGVTVDSDINYNADGLTLVWHFTTTAGAYTQTAVTPTDTGGNYDWVEQGNGMFTIEIPASGGASINNDTEGSGYFTFWATGIAPVRGPVYGFRKATTNNVLIDNAADTGELVTLDDILSEAEQESLVAGQLAQYGVSTHSAADVKAAIEAEGSSLAGIKEKTDQLTFTEENKVDATAEADITISEDDLTDIAAAVWNSLVATYQATAGSVAEALDRAARKR